MINYRRSNIQLNDLKKESTKTFHELKEKNTKLFPIEMKTRPWKIVKK